MTDTIKHNATTENKAAKSKILTKDDLEAVVAAAVEASMANTVEAAVKSAADGAAKAAAASIPTLQAEALQAAAMVGAQLALDVQRASEPKAVPTVEKRFLRRDREVFFKGTMEEFRASPEHRAITNAIAERMVEDYGKKKGFLVEESAPWSTTKKVAVGIAVAAAVGGAAYGGTVVYKKRQAKV